MSIVLCNAGPLIALGKLNRLDLLADLLITPPRFPRAATVRLSLRALVDQCAFNVAQSAVCDA